MQGETGPLSGCMCTSLLAELLMYKRGSVSACLSSMDEYLYHAGISTVQNVALTFGLLQVFNVVSDVDVHAEKVRSCSDGIRA